jgi:hypothetical protein
MLGYLKIGDLICVQTSMIIPAEDYTDIIKTRLLPKLTSNNDHSEFLRMDYPNTNVMIVYPKCYNVVKATFLSIESLPTNLKKCIYYNMSSDAIKLNYKFIFCCSNTHKLGLLAIKGSFFLIRNGQLIIKQNKFTISAENVIKKLYDVKMNMIKRQVIKMLKYKRDLNRERKLKLTVIMRMKAIMTLNKKIREFILLKIRQFMNKKVRKIKKTTYSVKITNENPEMNICSIHRISFGENQVIEILKNQVWVIDHDKQLISNYDILNKMFRLGFIPPVAEYALSNLASKDPVCYIKKGTRWQKLKLLRHTKSLCRKDYNLLIKWINKLSTNDEFNKLTKARSPIMPYWSKLTSRVIRNLRKMDNLHLVDSEIVHHLKDISWYHYEFCYTIIRTILFLNEKNFRFFKMS